MTHGRRLMFLLILSLLLLAVPEAHAQKQRGRASYYANKFHGRRMSNGQLYHRDSLTCAHRTLPFGTMVHVRNLSNQKSVIVRVTDRGPFVRGRIIDLSLAAARQIGMIAAGHANVEIEPVDQEREEETDAQAVPMIILPDLRTGEAHTAAEWERIARSAQQERQRADSLRQKPLGTDFNVVPKAAKPAAQPPAKKEKTQKRQWWKIFYKE